MRNLIDMIATLFFFLLFVLGFALGLNEEVREAVIPAVFSLGTFLIPQLGGWWSQEDFETGAYRFSFQPRRCGDGLEGRLSYLDRRIEDLEDWTAIYWADEEKLRKLRKFREERNKLAEGCCPSDEAWPF